MRPRLRRRLSPVLAGAVFGASVFGAVALGAPTSGAVPVTSGGFGGFEIDGNMQGADGSDWSSAAGVVAVQDDTADSGFHSSVELSPSTWDCNTNGDDPKSGNIQRAYVRPRVTAGGDQFLDLAWVREAANGAVNLAFEFNQVGTPGPAPTSGDCPITRTPGDLLVTYNLANNAEIADIQLYTWSDDPAGSGTDGSWVDQNLTSGAAFAAVNTTTVPDIDGGDDLDEGLFGEATINVGAALPASGTCNTFGVVNIRSRSSNSIDATLKDRLPTTGADVSNCGSIQVEKDDDLDAPVSGATFEVSKDADVVGSCTTDGTGTCEVNDLRAGQYSVREISAPDGYVLDDTVQPATVATGQTTTVLFTNFKIKYDLDITDGGENLVGTTRTFTVTARTDTGSGFEPLAEATPVVALVPGSAGSISHSTCDEGTSLLGTCTVTVTSGVPGGTTVEASLAGAAPVSAENVWIAYLIQVSPATDVHPVDTEQIFTVTLQIDRGDGFGPAADEAIDLDLDGVGSIGSDSCTTGEAGTCLVTVISPDPGTSELTATYHAAVSGTDRDFTDEGRKTWIAEEEIETPGPTDPPVDNPSDDEDDNPPADNPPLEETPAQDPPAQNPSDGKTDVSGETAGDVPGRLDPPVTPPTSSPVNQAELPRTGADIRAEALLALVMLLAGLSAQLLGRRRPKAV